MKSFIVFALFVAAAVAAPAGPAGPDASAQIVAQELNNIGVDGFNYKYETSNGIYAQESGVLANPGTDNEAIQVRGSFSYTGPDNVVYTVEYTADENGFQARGAHLPQAL